MTKTADISHDIAESLKILGLTKYEALVYAALLQIEGGSATDIHEISGVPRASVYPVLDRLLQKDLVTVSHSTPKMFAAIPPDEGIDNLLKHIENAADDARKLLNDLYQSKLQVDHGSQEMIWSIQGREKVVRRILEMILGAREHIRIIAAGSLLEGEIARAIESRDGEISGEVFCNSWKGDVSSLKTIRIVTKRPPQVHPIGKEMGGFLIVDGIRALVLMGSAGSGLTALYSESPGFLNFLLYYSSFVETIVEKMSQNVPGRDIGKK